MEALRRQRGRGGNCVIRREVMVWGRAMANFFRAVTFHRKRRGAGGGELGPGRQSVDEEHCASCPSGNSAWSQRTAHGGGMLNSWACRRLEAVKPGNSKKVTLGTHLSLKPGKGRIYSPPQFAH